MIVVTTEVICDDCGATGGVVVTTPYWQHRYHDYYVVVGPKAVPQRARWKSKGWKAMARSAKGKTGDYCPACLLAHTNKLKQEKQSIKTASRSSNFRSW